MEPEGSFPCSQEPAAGPCPEPHEFRSLMRTELKNSRYLNFKSKGTKLVAYVDGRLSTLNADVSDTRGGCLWMCSEIRMSGRKGNFVTASQYDIPSVYCLLLRGWVHSGSLSILGFEVHQQETYQLGNRDPSYPHLTYSVLSPFRARLCVRPCILPRVSCIVKGTAYVERYLKMFYSEEFYLLGYNAISPFKVNRRFGGPCRRTMSPPSSGSKNRQARNQCESR
jgi:hypothetical protein